MTGEWDSDNQREKFAIARSQKDAATSNENARATAQAVILINGGAATAVLAFLAKGSLPQSVFQVSAVCLAFYALGVFAGACMLYCAVRSLELYSIRWRLRAHPEAPGTEETVRMQAFNWWRGMTWCFYASIGVFISASLILATALFCTNQSALTTNSEPASQAPSPPPPPSAATPRATTPR